MPVTTSVLSSVVAPCKVSVPGVVAEPMVLTEDAPEPKVLTLPDAVPKTIAPEDVIVPPRLRLPVKVELPVTFKVVEFKVVILEVVLVNKLEVKLPTEA